MPNVHQALDSLVNIFSPTPGGKFFLGRADNPSIIVPRESIDGTLAQIYRDRRMVYIHNESGATGFAELRPGIGIDYQDYNIGNARLPILTEIKDGVRYISKIAPEGLIMLGGRTLTERTTQSMYSHNIEQLTLLRGSPTNPPSLSVRVDGTWVFRDPYTNGTGVFLSSTFDLATDIDALSADEHQIALVCFDPVYRVLTRVLNTAVSKPANKSLPCPEVFNVYDITAIDYGDYVPVVAVYIYYGQETIEEQSFYRIYPMRPMFNGDSRLLILPSASSAGISSNSFNANRMFHTLYAESGSSDYLDSITPIEERQAIFLQAGSGQTISVRHNQGNIFFNGGSGFELSGEKTLMLVHDGTNWSDIGTGVGGGTSSPLTTKGDVYTHDGIANARLPVGANGYVLTANSSESTGLAWSSPSGTAAYAYVLLRDEKAQNTSGGTFTSGAWRTRDLVETLDPYSVCSVSSNQFTLDAGTYIIRASAPAFAVERHQIRLQNVTDATTVAVGSVAYSNAAGYTDSRSELASRFTITSSKTFEIQHRCERTYATEGFGVESNFTTEIYTIVELWKEISPTFYVATLYDETLSSDGTFDVSSLSQNYDDLELKLMCRSDVSATSDQLRMSLNNDTTDGNYRNVSHFAGYYHDDYGVNSNRFLTYVVGNTGVSDEYTQSIIYIENYVSGKHKVARVVSSLTYDTTQRYVVDGSLWWLSTSAVNRIAIAPITGTNLKSGSRLTIIGKKR